MLQSYAPGRLYWSRIEVPFRQFLGTLPPSSDQLDRKRVLVDWFGMAQRLGGSALDAVCESVRDEGWNMKAAIEAQRTFRWGIRDKCATYLDAEKEVSHG